MRKIIAILLSLVLVLSFTACGGNSNIMEFEPDICRIEEWDSGEFYGEFEFEANLQVDLENLSLEYSDDTGTYIASLEEFDEPLDYSGTGYHVRWVEPPKKIGPGNFSDFFEIPYSYLCIYPEGKDETTAVLGHCLDDDIIVDYMVIQLWNLK